MSQPMDEMYVELHAKGLKETARDVKNTIDDIEDDLTKAARDIDSAFSAMANDIQVAITDAGATITRVAAKQEREWKDTAEAIGTDVSVAAEVAKRAMDDLADEATHDLRRIDRQADRTGRNIAGMFAGGLLAGGLGSLVSGIGSAVGSAGSAIGSIGSTLSSIGGAAGTAAMVAAMISAIPVVLALGGALTNLLGALGALPAAFATVIAIMAPLKLAFSGIGEAVSALASGNLEKINKAMEDLAPNARKFAKELYDLQGPLKELKFAVQDEFFGEFNGSLTRLVNATLPTLKTGLGDVGGALGRLGRDLTQVLGSDKVVTTIGKVFESATRIVDNLRPRLAKLLEVLFGAIERGLPFIERAADGLGEMLDKFTAFLAQSFEDGSFSEWMETAFTTLKNIGNLLLSLGKLFFAVFGSAGEEGDSFIVTLTQMVDKLTEFFNSAEGQDALNTFLEQLPVIGEALVTMATALGVVIYLLAKFSNALTTVVEWIALGIIAVVEFFKAVGEGAVAAWNAAGDFFSSIGDFFVGVGDWASDAWDKIVAFFGQLGDFFSSLPGKIVDALQALPDAVAKFFGDMFNKITYLLGYGLGAIVNFFISLPERITGALSSLWSAITSAFTSVRDTATSLVRSLVDSVINFFTGLPERITSAINSIVDFVRGVFTRARDGAISTVSNLVTSVVGFFQALPGRIMEFVRGLPGRVLSVFRDLANRAVSIGRDIIRGIVDGIRNGVGTAVQAAKNAAMNILRGFKNALGIHSPSSVMADQVGEQLPPGIDIGFQRRMPDLRRTINNALTTLTPPNLAVAGAGVGAGSGSIAQMYAQTNGATDDTAPPSVIVYLGTRQITDILDVRVERALKNQGRELTQGVRQD